MTVREALRAVVKVAQRAERGEITVVTRDQLIQQIHKELVG